MKAQIVRRKAREQKKFAALALAFTSGVAVLACLGYAKSKLKGAIAARPTFYAHSDWNTPRTPPANVAIKYQLRFNSNRSAGQDRVETHGASLIQKREIL